MRAKLASLILFTSIISVTQVCSAGHDKTKYAPSIQACKATVFELSIERKEEAKNSALSGKSRRVCTLVGGTNAAGP